MSVVHPRLDIKGRRKSRVDAKTGALLLSVAALACAKSTVRSGSTESDATLVPMPEHEVADARDVAQIDAGTSGARFVDASDDAHAAHRSTVTELLALLPADAGVRFFPSVLGNNVAHMNQGNAALSQHAVSQRACLEGLAGAVLQTPAQRAICGDENMVPIYAGGKPETAKTCMDIFEFPNKTCELPFVWVAPSVAKSACERVGKRLCSQDEWAMACRADPEGGADSVYSYGNELDLEACNTNKPHPMGPDGKTWICNARDAETAWRTCQTDTEPAGSFPKCRSRLGVYDMSGNVAEIMSRSEGGTTYSQLKGSAFFYVDVARKHNEPQPKNAPRETYPDHCNFNPRWHVETLARAGHVSYHLGFRCCKSVATRY
jgi:formylglycine-generating enzyme